MSLKRESQRRLEKIALSVVQRSKDPARHKCFVSYHVDDETEVAAFIENFGGVFIPTVVGITDDDDFVDSDDSDYIMYQIRQRYLSDSTVTIVMIGRCTWARRFVDWEVYASLRNYNAYGVSGLVAYSLPSVANYSGKQLPPRVNDNVVGDDKYARWFKYPSDEGQVRAAIEEAFQARSTKSELIDNSRARKRNNSSCYP